MLIGDYINGNPYIDIKAHRVSRQIVVTIGGKTGEIEISLDWKDAKELCEDLDRELYSDSRSDVEEKLEEAEVKISELEDRISELKSKIEILEGK